MDIFRGWISNNSQWCYVKCSLKHCAVFNEYIIPEFNFLSQKYTVWNKTLENTFACKSKYLYEYIYTLNKILT